MDISTARKVEYTKAKDESYTPDKIAAYSVENGYYVEGTGTSWALMEDLPKLYGIKVHHGNFRHRSKRLEGTGRGTGGKIEREEGAGAHRGKEKRAEGTGRRMSGKDSDFSTVSVRDIGCVP